MRLKMLLTLALVLSVLAGPLTSPAPTAAGEVLEGRFPTEEVFVDQAFRDFLSRPPDTSGLAFWSERLRDGTTPDELIEHLLHSPEFEGTTAPVVRLYRSIFDRQPDLEGLRFWVGERRKGDSLIRLADRMLGVAEFRALAEASTTDEIVAAVYGRSLGRTPDAAGLAFWIDEIQSGRRSLGHFVASVSEAPEHQALREPEVATTLIFLGLLQRVPDAAGLAFWTEQLASGTKQSSVVASVMQAPEYLARFPAAPVFADELIANDQVSFPWDVEILRGGELLVPERSGRLLIIDLDGAVQELAADLSGLFIQGETGLLGLALDPDFGSNRRFYTCQGNASPADVRVVAWTLDEALTTATSAGALVTGMPITTGIHGGCQLEFGADGFLYIGTGDATVGSTPQDLTSLGGKTLRVVAANGSPAPGNPFEQDANPATRLIFTLGHRNIQGLSARPGTTEMWSVEHGPDRDDEVNRLRPGGNGGWNPVPGYNQSVSMTDLTVPDAMPAVWSTGSPTLALSGAEFLDHPSWGSLNGGLAITALKDRSVRVLFFSDEGTYLGQKVLIEGTSLRFRGIHQAPDGSVYLTTSNGTDSIMKLTPG